MKALRISMPGQLPPSAIPTKLRPVPAASLLSTYSAWRILRRRTGADISRATFYRWVSSGKLGSIRLASRIYIPVPALDGFLQNSLNGD